MRRRVRRPRGAVTRLPAALLFLLALAGRPAMSESLCDMYSDCASLEPLIESGAIPHPRVFVPDLIFNLHPPDRETPASFVADDNYIENNAESWQGPYSRPLVAYWHVVPERDPDGTCVLVYEYHYYYAQNSARVPVVGEWLRTHEHDLEWAYVVVGQDQEDGSFNAYMVTFNRHRFNNHEASRCQACAGYVEGPYAPPGGALVPVRDSTHPVLHVDSGNALSINPVSAEGVQVVSLADAFDLRPACHGAPDEYAQVDNTPCPFGPIFWYGDSGNCSFSVFHLCSGDAECDDGRSAPWAREGHWGDPFPDDSAVFDVPEELDIAITATRVTAFTARWIGPGAVRVEARIHPDPEFDAFECERANASDGWVSLWRREPAVNETTPIAIRFDDRGTDPSSTVRYRIVGRTRDRLDILLGELALAPPGRTREAAGLLSVWPHPARRVVRFALADATPRPTRIELFDAVGRRVGTILVPIGETHVEWDLREPDGSRAGAGVYFAAVPGAVRKLVVIE